MIVTEAYPCKDGWLHSCYSGTYQPEPCWVRYQPEARTAERKQTNLKITNEGCINRGVFGT